MAGNLDDVSICTSTTKSVPRDFSRIENYKLIYYMTWKLSPDRVRLFHKNPSCYKNFLVLNFIMGITKPCTHLHPAPSTSSQVISTSIQLHPPPPSSFQSPPSSLQHPQQYLNQNIARNWAISPNLGQKIKSCPF